MKNRLRCLAAFMLFTGSIAWAAPPALQETPTDELQRTVDAFVGQWVYHGTATPPAMKGQAVKTTLRADCKKTARGKAVVCTMGGDIPGDGFLEAGLLVGYDTAGKVVHFMAMTSSEEVHDHRCSWKTATLLECEPLKSGFHGQSIVEELSFTYDGKVQTIKSISTMPDGSKVGLEVAGKRVKK